MSVPFLLDSLQHRIYTILQRYQGSTTNEAFRTLIENIAFLIRAGEAKDTLPSQISVITARSETDGIGSWRMAIMLHGDDRSSKYMMEAQADGGEDVLRELNEFVNTMILKAADQYGVWKS
jgi:hypothetical protein